MAQSKPNLIVEGSVNLSEGGDITGVQKMIGQTDLELFGDDQGGPDFKIGNAGNVGIGGSIFSNVGLNIRNIPNNATGQIVNVELNDGTNVLQIQADQDVYVVGDFFVSGGSKNFIIDHPVDPANYSLVHNAIEAPGYFTYYHGTVIIGPDSTAVVTLPDYFQALNSDFHYQLTCIGGYAQVYVSKEIMQNQFEISGGYPGQKVSWQISAERKDPWARDHPYKTKIKKESAETGKFWYPEGYGYAKKQLIGFETQNEIRKN